MNPPRPVRILFWTTLAVLALFGLAFLGLAVAGMVQFSALECGPRLEWTEANYAACSDIDETTPIFLRMGLPAVLPLGIALLIRVITRRSRAA